MYIKFDYFDPKEDKDIVLLFEFVIHYVPGKKRTDIHTDLEVSCCFGEINLLDLTNG